jgi:hypothetical protein
MYGRELLMMGREDARNLDFNKTVQMYILVILPIYENFSMKLASAECTVENS